MATKIHKGGYVDVRGACPSCGVPHSIQALKAEQDLVKADKSTSKCPMCGATFETPIIFLKRTREDAPDNGPDGRTE